MNIELIEKIGVGGFADVWKAIDELKRLVAVKIIRESAINMSDARSHAMALARINHPNVVKLHSLERVADPDTGDLVDCVVMEYIDGNTFAEVLQRGKLGESQTISIGLGLIDGVQEIHAKGLTHGDLHDNNILIIDGHAKIIDILYTDSLSIISSQKKHIKLNRDILGLKSLLQMLLHATTSNEGLATAFNHALPYDATIEQIRHEFLDLFNNRNDQEAASNAEKIYLLLMDEGFVENNAYANALSEETSVDAPLIILKKIIADRSYEYKHSNYVNLIWRRLRTEDRTAVLNELSAALDTELPKGKTYILLRFLQAIGIENFRQLKTLARIKTENTIIKDVLAGHMDIHGAKAITGGALGTYTLHFWQYFDDKVQFGKNLITMLHSNWYTQNYIGEYFMSILKAVADSTNLESEFIEGVKQAKNNDAKVFIRNIGMLPPAWQEPNA